MNSQSILSANVLDIIFDNRNKQYGAYALRKNYNERLYKAIGITFAIAAIFTLLSFAGKNKQSAKGFIFDEVEMVKVAEVALDKPIEPKKPEAPKAAVVAPAAPVKSAAFINNITITKDPLQASKLVKNLDSFAISNLDIPTEAPGAKVLVKAPVIPVVTGGGDVIDTKPVDHVTPMLAAEVMPAYPGGMAALRKFLERNLQNPQDLEDGQMVSVKIKFVVGYDGALKGFETVEDGGTAFNNEVIRVLKRMPGWIPGKSRGENVSVYYTIPVKFTAAE